VDETFATADAAMMAAYCERLQHGQALKNLDA